MRWSRLLLTLLLAAFAAVPARADYLEVRRRATIKEHPDGNATVLEHVSEGAVLRLASTTQTDGYYEVLRGGVPPTGWIYRTLVRRSAGDPPPGTPVSDHPETDLPTGSGTPASGADAPIDVSAFRLPNCPPEGNPQLERLKPLNRLKNRLVGPRPSIVTPLGLDEVLFPGDDTNRWSTDNAIEVLGYVAEVKPGGAETCNCRSDDAADYDTHIELVFEPDDVDDKTRHVVVEVTPAWRRFMATQGKDWSTAKLRQDFKHKWVRVRGWMFFDGEHVNIAENTRPGAPNNKRGTAWEIHPITSIEPATMPIP